MLLTEGKTEILRRNLEGSLNKGT